MLSFIISKIHICHICLAGLLWGLNEVVFVKACCEQLTAVHIKVCGKCPSGGVCPVVKHGGEPGSLSLLQSFKCFCLASGTSLPSENQPTVSFQEDLLWLFLNYQQNEICFSKVIQKSKRFGFSQKVWTLFGVPWEVREGKKPASQLDTRRKIQGCPLALFLEIPTWKWPKCLSLIVWGAHLCTLHTTERHSCGNEWLTVTCSSKWT